MQQILVITTMIVTRVAVDMPVEEFEAISGGSVTVDIPIGLELEVGNSDVRSRIDVSDLAGIVVDSVMCEGIVSIGTVGIIDSIGTVVIIGTVSTLDTVGIIDSIGTVDIIGTVGTLGTVGIMDSIDTVVIIGTVSTLDTVGIIDSIGTVDIIGAIGTVGTVGAAEASRTPTTPTLISGIAVRFNSRLNTTIFSNTLRQEYAPLCCDVTEGMVITGNEDEVSPFGSIHLPSPVLALQVKIKLAVFCTTFSVVLLVYSPSLSTLPSTLIWPPSTIKHSCN